MRIRNKDSVIEVAYVTFTSDNHLKYKSLFENVYISDIAFSNVKKEAILSMLSSNGYVNLTEYGVTFR